MTILALAVFGIGLYAITLTACAIANLAPVRRWLDVLLGEEA